MSRNTSFKYFPGHEGDNSALDILLVSTSQDYLDKLQQNLYITREIQSYKRSYQLKVHTCKQIDDVLNLSTNSFTVDYVVFILDVNNEKCLIEVRNNMDVLDSTFSREKMCLVNPNPSFYDCTINPSNVWDVAEMCQVNLINGQLDDPERRTNVSKQILNLSEACCGIVNGLPLVGVV